MINEKDTFSDFLDNLPSLEQMRNAIREKRRNETPEEKAKRIAGKPARDAKRMAQRMALREERRKRLQTRS